MTIVFEQIYLGCLAQASYLIGSQGKAVVVDPRRDVDDYVQQADAHGLAIEHVILTHVHADFVAGHSELAARGARIHISHRAACGFERSELRDGDVLQVGDARIEVLETPGHTPSDVCLLVQDVTTREPARLLTGDTLFIGDVGRPDLAGGLGHSAADMASMMYDSLRAKILPLPDDVLVFPGHGAGSACGRNISSERSSTLGQQRIANPALQPMTREQFVGAQTDCISDPPRYFARAAALNLRGPRLLRELPPMRTASFEEVTAAQSRGAQIVDARSAARHGEAHLAGSINVGLSGQFESWCGTLLDLDRPVVLVSDGEAGAQEARLRLARVAIEDVPLCAIAGTRSLAPGQRGVAALPQLSVHELREKMGRGGWQVVDVRRAAEYEAGHAPGAVHVPLDTLPGTGLAALAGLSRERPTAIICGSGYRSSTASHYLRRAGFRELHNVTGGTNAWIAAGFAVER